jgi:type II secretory pathway pseudopilin PulG
MKAKKGISLIVLVITIIVIIILAGAVILNLTKNNPMNSAKVASLTSTREALESAVLLYTQQIIASTNGDYSSTDILSGLAVKTPGTTPVYYQGIIGAAVTGINSTTYKIDSTKTAATIDMALPTAPTGSYWCVDVASGKCYLAFDSAATFPTYMGGTTSTAVPYLPTNSTLAGFVVGLAA